MVNIINYKQLFKAGMESYALLVMGLYEMNLAQYIGKFEKSQVAWKLELI